MDSLGKTLVYLGILLIFVGILVWGFGRIPLLGRLPGDIYIGRGNTSFYFPLATCILLSIVVSLLFGWLRR